MTKLYIEKTKKTFSYKDPNGELYRLDGPAIEYENGNKVWYQNDKLHRLDGPAVEWANGRKFYYYQDKYFPDIKTNEQWKRHLKWMKFE